MNGCTHGSRELRREVPPAETPWHVSVREYCKSCGANLRQVSLKEVLQRGEKPGMLPTK